MDSVVLSGGEPTLQKGLIAFCRRIKKAGYLVKLDTNGSRPHVIKRLIEEELIDFVAMDIKAEKAALGPNADAVIKSMVTWGNGLVQKGIWSADDYEEFKIWGGTAAGIKARHEIGDALPSLYRPAWANIIASRSICYTLPGPKGRGRLEWG